MALLCVSSECSPLCRNISLDLLEWPTRSLVIRDNCHAIRDVPVSWEPRVQRKARRNSCRLREDTCMQQSRERVRTSCLRRRSALFSLLLLLRGCRSTCSHILQFWRAEIGYRAQGKVQQGDVSLSAHSLSSYLSDSWTSASIISFPLLVPQPTSLMRSFRLALSILIVKDPFPLW